MDSTTLIAWKIALSVIGIALFILGVASWPSNFSTWRIWIGRMLDYLERHKNRWVLVVVGPLVVIAAWLPWQKWIGSAAGAKQAAIDTSQWPERFLIADLQSGLDHILERTQHNVLRGVDRATAMKQLKDDVLVQVESNTGSSIAAMLGTAKRDEYMAIIQDAKKAHPDEGGLAISSAAQGYLLGLFEKRASITLEAEAHEK